MGDESDGRQLVDGVCPGSPAEKVNQFVGLM